MKNRLTLYQWPKWPKARYIIAEGSTFYRDVFQSEKTVLHVVSHRTGKPRIPTVCPGIAPDDLIPVGTVTSLFE